MISIIQLKQLNYVNEQLGFTITWDALYELNQKYTEFRISGVLAAKNMGFFDWHCCVTDEKNNDSDIDGSNHIIIDTIKYCKRSKCIRTRKMLTVMSSSELLELSFAHKCQGNTKTNRRELTVPYCRKCDSFNPETKTDEIIFDLNEHPKCIASKPLKVEGFIFCFIVSFDVFLNNMATKYKVDLSKVQNWDLYDSKINPFWTHKGNNVSKFGALVTTYTKPRQVIITFNGSNTCESIDNAEHKCESHTSNDSIMTEAQTNIEIPAIIAMPVINMQSNETDNDLNMPDLHSNIESSQLDNQLNMSDMMNRLAELEIETQTTSNTYVSHPPPLGRIKTESIIVDCFRKELIPFIDCTINNNDIQHEMTALCQKYFFTMKQLKQHKYALLKMRRKDPMLKYFDNVKLPVLNVKNKRSAAIDTNLVEPIQIVQEWIMSFIDNALECPFTANQMLKWIRNEFETEQKQQEELNNIDTPIVMSVTDLCTTNVNGV